MATSKNCLLRPANRVSQRCLRILLRGLRTLVYHANGLRLELDPRAGWP